MRLITKCQQCFCLDINSIKHLAKPNVIELQDRTIFIVEGNDTEKFLQGITTNNINLLYPEKYPNLETNSKRISLYTMFLNPKGKIITDALIIRPKVYSSGQIVSKNNQLWIETDKDTSQLLGEHLQRYSWKKKVNIHNLSDLQDEEEKPKLFAGFSPMRFQKQKTNEVQKIKSEAGFYIEGKSASNKMGIDDQYANIAFYDPRASFLGVRLLTGPQGFDVQGEATFAQPKVYEFYQKTYGIASGKTMRNRLPFMFNADLLNGFSFNKGCYLGQQIVSRSYFTGIVRRRVFPFISVAEDINLKEGQGLFDEQNKEVGKVVEAFPGGGLILINYLSMLERFPLKIKSPVEGIVMMPFEEQLKGYIEEMRKKQEILSQIDL